MTPSLLDHAPALTPAAAAVLVRDRYGLEAELRPLPSERDQNFLVSARDGAAYVLKIANALEDPSFLAGQNRLLTHLAAAGCPVPRPVPAMTGETTVRTREGGTEHLVRLVTWLPGTPLAERRHHGPDLLASLGAELGRMDRALAGFDEPACHRNFHWDLQGGFDRARTLLSGVGDPGLRTGVERVLAVAAESTSPHLPRLRRSIIHGDANDYNVLVRGDRVIGLIDFGDAVYSWTAGNLAVAVAYAMLGKADPLAAAAAMVRGYCAVFPLTEDELAALWGLALLRLVLSVGHAAAQRAVRPGDPYLAVSQAPIRDALPRLLAVHPRFAEAVLRHAAGLSPVRRAAPVLAWLEEQRPRAAPVMKPDPRVAPTVVLDWGVASPMLSGDLDANTEPVLTARVTAAMREAGAEVGIGRYDEPRLLYSSPLFAGGGPFDERRTVHLGLDLFASPGTPVLAPLPGRVHTVARNAAPLDYGPVVILEHTTSGGDVFFTLYGHLSVASLDGLAIGTAVAAGQQIATLGDAGVNGGWTPHLHVQLILDLLELGADYPGVCRPGEREVWKAFSPDPNLVLGIPAERFPAPEPDLKQALAARRQRLGGSLSVAYRRPLKIVRGYAQHLWDHEGRRYLDAYNNVPHVGHCHPRVVAAGQRQMALLNTNTRYLHDLIHQFAAELTATLPPSLEVCWFLNSASEANELALRLARARTGRRDMIVLEAAYHGHTSSLIDLSPYKHGGPGGEGPPDWVHAVSLPDRYRGRYRGDGPEVAASYARHVEEAVDHLEAAGRGVAGFMAETCPSVGGQIFLPDGYLTSAYRAVRARGGVCIADEVQTGYGRIGTHFWAFLAHNVVPDIVVMGKPMGNGHPLAAVVATRDVAEAFDTGMEFFSTFGGNPVSCAIGLEVLRVTQEEQLQAHALTVGERLLTGLRSLADRHALAGDIRGSGLFVGVELVNDRNARTPAGDKASGVVNRMRDLGILLGTDGPDHNVVKIRPPMPFSADDADRLVAALDQALSDVAE